jgi:hypothetical protein
VSTPTDTWNDVAMPRPKTGETPKRNIRVPDTTWDAAHGRAAQEDRTLSAVVNSYLARYGAALPDDAPSGDPWELVNLVMKQYAEGRVGPTTDLGTAVDAAADLLRALGIRAVGKEAAE